MTRIAVNGVRLNVEVTGRGPALLLLHGFTGSSATWASFSGAWQGFTTIAVDLLGHGRSDCPSEPGRYGMERCVEDLVALLDRLEIGRAAVLGYSMGGRVALHLTLRVPQRVWALILESASPGIQDTSQRKERLRSDAALAATIEQEGVEAFVGRWEKLPLFANQTRLPPAHRAELRSQRLRNDPLGLANSLRGLGAGAQEPLGERISEIKVPVLLLVGALDARYCALAREMAALLPCHQVESVPDCGHAVHIERPSLFASTVLRFLEECQQGLDRRCE